MRSISRMVSVILYTFLLINFSSAGSYDVHQLREARYQIDIGTSPAGFPPDAELLKLNLNDEEKIQTQLYDQLPQDTDTSLVFIRSKTGQLFACTVPEIPNKEKALPIGDSLNPRYVADIVAAGFYVNKCIQRNTGWWTYELCRGQSIKQFHGKKGKPEYAEYSLGMFTGQFEMPEYSYSTKEKLLYMGETYSGGSMCDVVGKQVPRKAFVKFECDPLLSTSEAYIDNVNEMASCEYEITVKIGSLCKLGQFVPPEEKEAPLMVGCRPFVEKERVLDYAKRLQEKERRKKEGKETLKKILTEIDSIQRRRTAFNRGQILKDPRNHFLSKRLEAEYKAVMDKYMVTTYLAKEGSFPTEQKLDALKKIGRFADEMNLFMGDFDSLEDMDRGQFWYYLKDIRWPKDEYPMTLDYVDLINAYRESAEKIAFRSGRSLEKMREILERAKKDPFQKNNNVLVNAEQLLPQLDSYFPSWYARDGDDLVEYKDLVNELIYHNDVVDQFIEILSKEYKEGVEVAVNRTGLLYELAKNLAPLAATVKMTDPDNSLSQRAIVLLMEKLMYATEYAQMTFEVRHPRHTLSFKGTYSDKQKSLATSGYWNEYYSHMVKGMSPIKRDEQLKELDTLLVRLTEEVEEVAFMEVWTKMADDLVEKRRKKLDIRNPLLEVLGGRSAMALPFGSDDQSQIMELLQEAGLADLDVKVQVISMDGGVVVGEQSEEMKKLVDDLVDSTMETIQQKAKADKREKAYWKRVEEEEGEL